MERSEASDPQLGNLHLFKNRSDTTIYSTICSCKIPNITYPFQIKEMTVSSNYRWILALLFTGGARATVCVHMCCNLPVFIRVMEHVQYVWQSPSLGFWTNAFRDLDSNKDYEHTMCSCFQQIGWTCKEANTVLFTLDWVSCGKVTLWSSTDTLGTS